MTAIHRLELREVAVKFIIKAKVPEHAWMEDKAARRVPTEALLLGLLEHPNIVKCLDLFEDELYFYLVSRHIMTLCVMIVPLTPCHRYRNSTVLRGCRPMIRRCRSWPSRLERPRLISPPPH
jgi:serine/threonine protein kinase